MLKLFIFIRFIHFIYEGVCCLCVHVCTWACLVPVEVNRGHWTPETGVTDGCVHCVCVLGMESRSSARATRLLTAETSFRPLISLILINLYRNNHIGLVTPKLYNTTLRV